MIIFKIKFKRIDKNSFWENGLFIEPSDIIIDSLGKVVEGIVYDLQRQQYDFCLDLQPLMNKEN